MSVFDLAGSIGRGQSIGARQVDLRRKNALSDLYQQQGPGIMDGDPGALNALARMDPMQAMQARGTVNSEARAAQGHQMGLQIDAARLKQIRQQTSQAAAKEAARMSGEQRKQEADYIRGVATQARAAIVQGERAWEAFIAQHAADLAQQGIDVSALTYDVAPMALAGIVGTLDGLKAGIDYTDSFQKGGTEPSSVQALRIRAQEAGLKPGTPGYQEFMRSGGKVQTSETIYGPDGQVILQRGGGSPPKLTMDASKNTGFYIRMKDSNEVINSLEDQGTRLGQQSTGAVPFGLGNYMQDSDFQKFDQARRDFVNAILRRESGAHIADSEFANANKQYFPMPGDGPEVIAQKRKNRENAIIGTKIGSGGGVDYFENQVQGQTEDKTPKTFEDYAKDPTNMEMAKKYGVTLQEMWDVAQ